MDKKYKIIYIYFFLVVINIISIRIFNERVFLLNDFYILEHCRAYIAEMDIYSWQEDKAAPEDGNDHLINSCQYAWLPYRSLIGSVKNEI